MRIENYSLPQILHLWLAHEPPFSRFEMGELRIEMRDFEMRGVRS